MSSETSTVPAALASSAALSSMEEDEHVRSEIAAPLGPGSSAIDAQKTLGVEDESSLEYEELPPFPEDAPIVPLLRINLKRLINGEQDELDKLWRACCDLGFFYLNLRSGKSDALANGLKSPEQKELIDNPWGSGVATPKEDDHTENKAPQVKGGEVDGDQLLKEAYELFPIGEKVFALPLQEKQQYDLKDQNSYFGYKGYGAGAIDAKGSPDRNEFYNVSKDDILGISKPLPAPDVLDPHRELLESFIKHSHAIVTLLLRLLNARLDLPSEKLPSLHRLSAVSGDQVRWVYSPPQPEDDRRTALGEHTDFGSITILFNRLGGLQVLPPDSNEWAYVKPLKDHAVVNLGDAMVKFTAGVLRSNIHRVVNPPGEQAESTRLSLVYFSRPEDEVVLRTLEGSEIINEKKKANGYVDGDEEAVTSKEWILRRALGRRGKGAWEQAMGTDGERLNAQGK